MIKQIYLQDLKKLKEAFYSDKEFSHLILFDFLEDEFYRHLKDRIDQLQFKKDKQPLTHSFSKAEAGELLIELIESVNFKILINAITNKNIDRKNIFVYNLTWEDYTILNDQKKEDGGFDIIIDFTNYWDKSYGGSLIYVNGNGDYLKIPTKKNTFSIVKRKKGVNRFIKYVNNHAKDRSRTICLISF